MSDSGRPFLDGAVDSSTVPVNRGGRPTNYRFEIVGPICDAIASGMEMEKVVELPGFPGRSTFFTWLAIHPEFQAAYAGAMQWRGEADADWLMNIALDKSQDYKLEDAGGANSVPVKVFDKTAVSRSELACKYLWKLMESRNPKKYRPPEQAVIMPPAPPGQFQPGDDARLIGQGSGTIEPDPMQDQIDAWRKARAG